MDGVADTVVDTLLVEPRRGRPRTAAHFGTYPSPMPPNPPGAPVSRRAALPTSLLELQPLSLLLSDHKEASSSSSSPSLTAPSLAPLLAASSAAGVFGGKRKKKHEKKMSEAELSHAGDGGLCRETCRVSSAVRPTRYDPVIQNDAPQRTPTEFVHCSLLREGRSSL